MWLRKTNYFYEIRDKMSSYLKPKQDGNNT